MTSARRSGFAVAAWLLAAAATAPAPPDPAATLRGDALDAAAATSAEDARRAAAAAASGHAMAHGTYRQVDAGRDDVPVTSPVGEKRRGSAPADAPGADPHAGHAMPAAAAPADPHAGHHHPAPSPSPEARR